MRHQLIAVSFAAMLTACGLNPQQVDAIPSERDFRSLTCEQLAAEKERIEAAFVPIRFSNQHGVMEKIGRLKGEAIAVDDAVRIKGCPLRQ